MTAADPTPVRSEVAARHLENVAANLQLVADMGYGDVALAVVQSDGSLRVLADARPNTAVAPFASSRAGRTLDPTDEPEAYSAISGRAAVLGERTRVARGIKFTTAAWPIGRPTPIAVVVRNLAEQVGESSGAMERAFMEVAEELLGSLTERPLADIRTGEPFATVRTAGDGVIRVSADGRIAYASPNAVNIMRLAGVDGTLVDTQASALPGGGFGISPVLGSRDAISVDAEVAERVLGYRSIGVAAGALVLVEDLTEARRREQEIKVKEATIREVHHRVKNNLQTIASLLRIQARRSDSDETRRALAEATERVGSMAVVHDLLAGSDEECVDFAAAARTVVDMVAQGLVGQGSGIRVSVIGTTGQVDAHTATSLALAVAELVHNALEHGLADREQGQVEVSMRRVPGELVLTVRDDGVGLPAGFDPSTAAHLGLEIVRTVVEDDLRGTLSFSGGRGTTVTVRVPLSDVELLGSASSATLDSTSPAEEAR
jgi:two-component sensor histidine kinase/PAS domain-containing protein